MTRDEKWIRRMADAEDRCPSVSVGGLAADLGLYREPLCFCGHGFSLHPAAYPDVRCRGDDCTCTAFDQAEDPT